MKDFPPVNSMISWHERLTSSNTFLALCGIKTYFRFFCFFFKQRISEFLEAFNPPDFRKSIQATLYIPGTGQKHLQIPICWITQKAGHNIEKSLKKLQNRKHRDR